MARILCWFGFHKWHELYDPDDIFENKFMCERCLKFNKEI